MYTAIINYGNVLNLYICVMILISAMLKLICVKFKNMATTTHNAMCLHLVAYSP